MNDLRSRNRTLAPVRTLGPRTGEIVSGPPGGGGGKKRKGKKPNPLFQGSKPDVENRRRARVAPSPAVDTAVDSAADRAADTASAADAAATAADARAEAEQTEHEPTTADPLSFEVSRQLRSMAVTALPDRPDQVGELVGDNGDSPATVSDDDQGPASRPARRRELVDDDLDIAVDPELDDDDAEDDKFPWHFQFDDDEPQELQAKSPLLSRAFRSSVG